MLQKGREVSPDSARGGALPVADRVVGLRRENRSSFGTPREHMHFWTVLEGALPTSKRGIPRVGWMGFRLLCRELKCDALQEQKGEMHMGFRWGMWAVGIVVLFLSGCSESEDSGAFPKNPSVSGPSGQQEQMDGEGEEDPRKPLGRGT